MTPRRNFTNPEITITFDLTTLNMIIDVLSQQPFGKVADTIVEIKNQAQAQLQLLNQQGQPAAEREPV